MRLLEINVARFVIVKIGGLILTFFYFITQTYQLPYSHTLIKHLPTAYYCRGCNENGKFRVRAKLLNKDCYPDVLS
jgi:hypothetical protein